MVLPEFYSVRAIMLQIIPRGRGGGMGGCVYMHLLSPANTSPRVSIFHSTPLPIIPQDGSAASTQWFAVSLFSVSPPSSWAWATARKLARVRRCTPSSPPTDAPRRAGARRRPTTSCWTLLPTRSTRRPTRSTAAIGATNRMPQPARTRSNAPRTASWRAFPITVPTV